MRGHPDGSVCLKVKCVATQCEQRRHIPAERTCGRGRTSLDLRAMYETMNLSHPNIAKMHPAECPGSIPEQAMKVRNVEI